MEIHRAAITRSLCLATCAVFLPRQATVGKSVSDRDKAGRVRIQLFGKCHSATWKVVNGSIEVTSAVGVGIVRLGGLESAPSIAACEKLREMVLQANRSVSPKTDRARFNVRDA